MAADKEVLLHPDENVTFTLTPIVHSVTSASQWSRDAALMQGHLFCQMSGLWTEASREPRIRLCLEQTETSIAVLQVTNTVVFFIPVKFPSLWHHQQLMFLWCSLELNDHASEEFEFPLIQKKMLCFKAVSQGDHPLQMIPLHASSSFHEYPLP